MVEHSFESVDGAATVLEAMVNELDVATLTGDAATRLVKRLVTTERVLAAARARGTKRAADANQWRHAGERSPASWAARLTGTTTGQAAAELDTAAKLAALPATDAARRAGRISDLHAREITSAATADPAAEAELLRRAAVDDATAFKRRCAEVRAAAERDEAAARERIRRARRFRSWTDAEGGFCFAGRGLPEEGAALLAAMKPYQDRAFHTARRRGDHDTTDAYAYDALIAMAHHDAGHHCPTRPSGEAKKSADTATGDTGAPQHRAQPHSAGANTTGTAPGQRGGTIPATCHTAGTPAAQQDRTTPGTRSGTTGSTPGATGTRHGQPTEGTGAGPATLFSPSPSPTTSTGRQPSPGAGDELAHRDAVLADCFRPGPRAKLIVRIDHTALISGHTTPGETCEIAGIGPIPVATARQLARDAFLTAVVTDGTDIRTVVHLGRAATAHQRTALEARGTICAVPGCGTVHGLEIDHVDGWAVTRRTHIDQLDWLCHHHHQQKTHHSWRLNGPPGNRTWLPPGQPDP